MNFKISPVHCIWDIEGFPTLPPIYLPTRLSPSLSTFNTHFLPPLQTTDAIVISNLFQKERKNLYELLCLSPFRTTYHHFFSTSKIILKIIKKTNHHSSPFLYFYVHKHHQKAYFLIIFFMCSNVFFVFFYLIFNLPHIVNMHLSTILLCFHDCCNIYFCC